MPPKKEGGPAIIASGTTERTGIMRARDVRFELTGHADPRLIHVIAKIAEQSHTNYIQLAELATLTDNIIDIVQRFSDIAGNMKDKMMSLERGIEGEEEGIDDGNSSTH